MSEPDDIIPGDGLPVNESALATAPTLLTAVYTHNHECPWQDQQVTVRPNCQNGVAFLVAPICLSNQSLLEQVSITTE